MATFLPVHVNAVTVAVNLDDAGRPDGPAETISLSSEGKLAEEDGRFLLRYTERGNADAEAVQVTAEIEQNRVFIKRRGGVVADLLFAPDETSASLYRVPPYSFDMKITTKKMRSSFTPDGGVLLLRYRMEIGGVTRDVELRLGAEAI